jgi:tight adherence protein C
MKKSKYHIFFIFFAVLVIFLPTNTHAQRYKYNSMNPREVLALLKEECDKGYMANCYEAGLMYMGSKNESTKKKGKKYIVKACKGGHENACDNLKGGLAKDTGSAILFYSSIGLIGLAIFLVTIMMFQDEEEFKAAEKLEDSDKKDSKPENYGIVLRYSKPFFKRYVTPIVASMKSKKKIKEKYKRRLASAGLTEVLTPEDFFSFKIFLIVGFPIVFLAVRVFLEESWPLSIIPIIGAVGFVYPDIWIKGRVDMRQKEVIMAMPFCVDMLALSVEAGLDFVAAMTKVVEKAKKTALSEEFETMIKEIRIGASRAEALRNLAWRIDLIQISSFCATLIAADSVGASIGPILKALSLEIRQKKSSEVEKAGATAATKILFPMLFLIVPAVFIVVAAPIVLELVTAKK